jgi:hypothetical protein
MASAMGADGEVGDAVAHGRGALNGAQW